MEPHLFFKNEGEKDESGEKKKRTKMRNEAALRAGFLKKRLHTGEVKYFLWSQLAHGQCVYLFCLLPHPSSGHFHTMVVDCIAR